MDQTENETIPPRIHYTCNKCQQSALWHCPTCEQFDLCETCKPTVEHEHPMGQIKIFKIQFLADHSGDAPRYESIQSCVQGIVHACGCEKASCSRRSCPKMKRVIQHVKRCKKRTASCPVCKQFVALCCYHAKHCSREHCQVPFCMNIRQKLREQKLREQKKAMAAMARPVDDPLKVEPP